MSYQTKRLGDVCELVQKVLPADLFSKDFIYVDIASVDPIRRIIATPQKLNVREAPGRARKLLMEGDSIFATTRPYLENIAFVTKNFAGAIASTGFCVISPIRNLCDPKYIYYLIGSKDFIDQVLTKQKGASYPAVSDADIFNIEISMPPIEEQRKIVARLEKQFTKIDEVARLRAESEAATAALLPAALHEIFSQKGLREKEIGELCELVNGRAFKSSEWEQTGKYPIIRIQNLNNQNKEFNYFSGKVDPKIIIGNGDLLFSWSGSRGTSFGPHLWNRSLGLLNQHIFKVVHEKEIDRVYFYYALKHLVVEVENSLHGGVGLVHITKAKLQKLKIPFPSLAEQKEIVKKLDALSAKVRALQEFQSAQAIDLKALKQSILHQAFSGGVE